ncbi:MAG: hypothetical protein RBR48_04475, partial [Bacilli bacterium]|nr:hypothetical protein [Bacilli bacterium]
MENYEIIKKIENFSERLAELKKAIDVDKIVQSITEDEQLMSAVDFYKDMQVAQKVLKRVKESKTNMAMITEIHQLLEELELYFSMQKDEEGDLSIEITETI